MAGGDFIKNTALAALGVTNKYSSPASVDDTGRQFIVAGTGASDIAKAEDAPAADGDVGVAILGRRNDNLGTGLTSANGDYGNIAVGQFGEVFVTPYGANSGKSIGRAEDDVFTSGDMLVIAGAERDDTLTSNQSANHDIANLKTNAKGCLFVETAVPTTVTATQPSITTATSTQLLAANTARNWFLVQNNSAANIMISLTGATLTGIVPSGTNIGLVIAAGQTYQSPPNCAPTSAITCYQTSGGTITTISVVEG